MKRVVSCFFVVLVTILFSYHTTNAQIPRTLNLQSLVFDVDGNITTESAIDLMVRIIDSDGNILYSEEMLDVLVANGAISVDIGAANGGIPLSALDPSTGNKFLDVVVDGTDPFDLLPLNAVPYSIYAERALTVSDDSIESRHIKDGGIQLEDLAPGIAFSDIDGELADSQAPSTFTRDAELEAHLEASPAHKARNVSLSGLFANFFADDVQEAIIKLDAKLADEIVNRQAGQTSASTNITTLTSQISSNDTDITNLQTVTSNINNLPGTLGESKIDSSIARDSELSFGNISGTIANSQIPASIARDSEIPTVITDHGLLGGLSDNDHPQYLKRSGSQAMTGNLKMGGNNITGVGSVDGVDVSNLEDRVDQNEDDITILQAAPEGNQVAANAGYLSHGQTIALLGGYNADDCVWTAAFASADPPGASTTFLATSVSVDADREVTCRVITGSGTSSATCAYTIICIK